MSVVTAYSTLLHRRKIPWSSGSITDRLSSFFKWMALCWQLSFAAIIHPTEELTTWNPFVIIRILAALIKANRLKIYTWRFFHSCSTSIQFAFDHFVTCSGINFANRSFSVKYGKALCCTCFLDPSAAWILIDIKLLFWWMSSLEEILNSKKQYT